MKYFLRAGDFLPEEATEVNLKRLFGQYSSPSRSLEQLEADNNLFIDEEEVRQASIAIRSFLACFRIQCQERRQSALRTQMQSHNNSQQSEINASPSPCGETQSRCDEPQVPTEGNAPYPVDNSRCRAPRIDVTIQILP